MSEKESKQLLEIKANGKCATFKVEDENQFKDWRVVMAQRYANLNGGKSNLIASILGTLEEPIFKVKTNNDEEGILLVTITMYPSTKNIMIQGNFVQTWINEEWPKLAAIVGKKTTYLDTVWNDNWFDESDTILEKSIEVIEEDQNILPFSPSVVGPERRKKLLDRAKNTVSKLNLKKDEEIKSLISAIELLEDNVLSLKEENTNLKSDIEKLKDRVKQLENLSKKEKRDDLKLIEERLSKLENTQPEKKEKKEAVIKKKTQSYEQTSIGDQLKLITQGQLITEESINKTKRDLEKLNISIQEKIDKSSKTAEEFFTKKISEVQKIIDEHTKTISDIRNVNSIVNPAFDKEYVEEYIEQRILAMQRNDKELADESVPKVCGNFVEIEKNADSADWASHSDNSLYETEDFTRFYDRDDQSKNENEIHHLIIGDSIIQGIKGSLFHKGKNTQVVSLRGKGVTEVKEYIQKMSTQPKNIIIHCGSNDLVKSTSEDVSNKVAILIDIIKEKFKNSKILISIPLYRLGNEPFNRKIQKFGSLVKELCMEKRVTFMFHNNINKESDNFREDGVHLSTKGTALMVANMKNHLRKSNHTKNKPHQGNLFKFPNKQEDSSNSMLKHFLQGFLQML